MSNLDIIIIIGLVGSVASVVGVLIAAPTWGSRLGHVAYAFVLTVLSASIVNYQHRFTEAERQIEEMRRIERDAAALLEGFDFTTSGSMAGFMLAAMAFLEKHKDRLPDTYARSIELCENAGCLKTTEPGYTGQSDHFRNMQTASTALKYLIQGIAQGGS